MLSFNDYFVIFFVVILLFFYLKNMYAEVEYKKSKDGHTYLVRRVGNSQEAAEYLADIADRLEKIIKHYVAKHPDSKEGKRLYENFNKNNISEGSVESGYTSYSVNKGERIVLCIRQKDNSFVDKNIVMYVAIHELAHLGDGNVGHNESFWNFFRKLLLEAVEIGMYTKTDYSSNPQPYCGIQITHSVI